jgi:hypothetical protein
MELVVKCAGFFDQRGVASEFVGDNISFIFDKETAFFRVPVKNESEAEDIVSRLTLYDLDYPYICIYEEEGKEPKELTAY